MEQHNSPGYLAGLEEDLISAHQVRPGGQEPRPERIEAIEAEIARVRAAIETAEPEPEVAADSNDSTDYQSDELETAEDGTVKEKTVGRKAK